jgi:hypothetical protein
MSTWTSDELDRIGKAEELEIGSIVSPNARAATLELVPR